MSSSSRWQPQQQKAPVPCPGQRSCPCPWVSVTGRGPTSAPTHSWSDVALPWPHQKGVSSQPSIAASHATSTVHEYLRAPRCGDLKKKSYLIISLAFFFQAIHPPSPSNYNLVTKPKPRYRTPQRPRKFQWAVLKSPKAIAPITYTPPKFPAGTHISGQSTDV
ncbi:hypothetical protein GW17_00041308 [Ensete ventricosum]|nr:hypothetical protein GW17_00041308 [Ensete ventricosum]